MKKMVFALVMTSASLIAAAGQPGDKPPIGPIDVSVVNPVLPVEVSNADPIPVAAVMEENLAQYFFNCAQGGSERSCYVNLSTKIALQTNERFVIRFLNVYVRSHGDSGNPKDFLWFIGYGNGGPSFGVSELKRDYLGTGQYVGSENVLVLIDEFTSGGDLPQFGCVADRPNEAGETFSCDFVVTGYFAQRP